MATGTKTPGNFQEPTSTSGSGKSPREVVGFWGTRLKVTDEEREVITIGHDGYASEEPARQNTARGGGSKRGRNKAPTSATATGGAGRKVEAHTTPNASPRTTMGPANSWDDKLLRKLVQNGKWKKTAWLPGSGRHINEGRDAYEPFTHIVRTLHLEDAVQVLATNRMKPKSLITFSSLQNGTLPNDHPCKELKVLWFSARFKSENEEDPNWYGNVEFAVPCHLLLEMFQHCFLVEILTTPTHTVSRVLLTNTDYSSVLPHYNSKQPGGGWMVNQDGHFALRKCSRYRFRGTNMFDHVLEFMLEVTAKDEKKILSSCKLDFKNHEDARDTRQVHVCNRYQRLKQSCPTPYTSLETAEAFHSGLEKTKVNWNKIYPKLTEHAKQCLPEAAA
ncbi:uncharacterized protein LOC135209136 [Macrobrachium nipponense]|uniref:uncharacterized protein LOC135209136 n=1 Tax=Macrobrachium nipponense TaxID=159736 RepID=UPI0030C894F4